MNITIRSYVTIALTVAIAGGTAISMAFAQGLPTTNTSVDVSASAQVRSGDTANWQGRGNGMMDGRTGKGGSTGMMRGGIAGMVTTISGSTISVASHGFGTNTATTTYTVDATNAVVIKNNATSSLSAVAVGDRVIVLGTVTGTTVSATTIRDGILMRGRGTGAPGSASGQPGQMSFIKGNGQPVVAGTVSSVSGTSIVITTSSNTTYTLDASGATVAKNGTASTLSTVAVGDYVVVQGAINGSSVTASSVIDSHAPPATAANTSAGSANTALLQSDHPGFFGSIGNFFKHIFGF